MHYEYVHEGRGDFATIAVAGERFLNLGTVRIATIEETVQLHIVPLRVYNYPVRLEVTLKKFREIRTMT